MEQWIPIRKRPGRARLYFHIFSEENARTNLSLYLPFTGDEKFCYECGYSRELRLELELNGDLLSFRDICAGPARNKAAIEYDCAVVED